MTGEQRQYLKAAIDTRRREDLGLPIPGLELEPVKIGRFRRLATVIFSAMRTLAV